MNLSTQRTPTHPWILFAVPVVLVAAALVLQYSGLDEWLIRPFYDSASKSWPWDTNWWTAGLIHKGGRDLIAAILIALLLSFAASLFYAPLARFRWDLAYIVLSAAAGLLIVSELKKHTHIYIPASLTIFGGSMPHIRVFDTVPPGLPIGNAFPAGNASGPYSLIGVYFLLAARGSRWKYPALSGCLLLGILYGVAQQMRGKHFVSHDLFSLAICWGAALLLLYLMGIPRRVSAPAQSGRQPLELAS